MGLAPIRLGEPDQAGAVVSGNRAGLSLTHFKGEILGVGTSFQRVRFIISYALGTFFSSSKGGNRY